MRECFTWLIIIGGLFAIFYSQASVLANHDKMSVVYLLMMKKYLGLLVNQFQRSIFASAVAKCRGFC